MDSKDIAKEWVIGNEVCTPYDFVYGVPTCPTCGEVTYSMERCPFCNQLLKDPPECTAQEKASFEQNHPDCYTPNDGQYPLCRGDDNGPDDGPSESCHDCCLFEDYEAYHNQYDSRYE